jgi:serine phosphatase RsbU (regulator of sigma subunit)
VPAGTPFGVPDPARSSVSVTIEPAAALVAFTDGLVERRGEDIDVGLERVREAVGGAAPLNAAGLVQRVLDAVDSSGGHDDDVTVLVLRRE